MAAKHRRAAINFDRPATLYRLSGVPPYGLREGFVSVLTSAKPRQLIVLPPWQRFLFHCRRPRDRRVLELGAGMGVCGLIAHKTGAAAVVLTDGDSDAMKYLNEV